MPGSTQPTQDASYHQDYDMFCGEVIPYIPLFTTVTRWGVGSNFCKLPRCISSVGGIIIWRLNRKENNVVFSTTKNPWCLENHMVAFFHSGVTCRSRRWDILGMVGLECVLPHSGENSVLPGARFWRHERVVWLDLWWSNVINVFFH